MNFKTYPDGTQFFSFQLHGRMRRRNTTPCLLWCCATLQNQKHLWIEHNSDILCIKFASQVVAYCLQFIKSIFEREEPMSLKTSLLIVELELSWLSVRLLEMSAWYWLMLIFAPLTPIFLFFEQLSGWLADSRPQEDFIEADVTPSLPAAQELVVSFIFFCRLAIQDEQVRSLLLILLYLYC